MARWYARTNGKNLWWVEREDGEQIIEMFCEKEAKANAKLWTDLDAYDIQKYSLTPLGKQVGELFREEGLKDSQASLPEPALCESCSLAFSRTKAVTDAVKLFSKKEEIPQFAELVEKLAQDPDTKVDFHFCSKVFTVCGIEFTCKCAQHGEKQ